jgi:hypothetical protein
LPFAKEKIDTGFIDRTIDGYFRAIVRDDGRWVDLEFSQTVLKFVDRLIEIIPSMRAVFPRPQMVDIEEYI